MLKARTINWIRRMLMAGLIAFLLTVYIATSGCGKSHHDDHPILPGPTGATGSTPGMIVRHHVSIKHDSRSAPDSYRVRLNQVVLKDTTFTEIGDGQLVPFITFDTMSGDVLAFETPGRGSNGAFVDSTEFYMRFDWKLRELHGPTLQIINTAHKEADSI